MPMNTFLSKLILCAIIKNSKSISGVNYIESLDIKWCTLKKMGNWPFSPGHTLSYKINNILRRAADMTKVKTNMCRKHIELSVIAISSVLVKKGICVITFPTPTPKFYYFSQYVLDDFAHDIAKLLRYTSQFCFLYSLCVIDNTQTSFYGNTVLSYLPMDQPLKICVKQFWQKRVSLACIDRWKSDIAAFL